MSALLLSAIPTGLAAWLLLFGHDGAHRWPPRPQQVALVVGAGLLLGPVAIHALGPVGWLALIVALTTALTAYAALRRSGRLPVRG